MDCMVLGRDCSAARPSKSAFRRSHRLGYFVFCPPHQLGYLLQSNLFFFKVFDVRITPARHVPCERLHAAHLYQ